MDRVAKRDWTIRLAALAIFVLGFAAGALALNVYHTSALGRGGEPTAERFDRMFDKLGLDDNQRTQVKAIFADARGQMDEVRKECGPKFHEVRERTDARLREVLTPEQWQQFQQLTSEGRDHHRHGHDDASAPPAP
jgi:Spy/CpxP family protein refolding chaperone